MATRKSAKSAKKAAPKKSDGTLDMRHAAARRANHARISRKKR